MHGFLEALYKKGDNLPAPLTEVELHQARQLGEIIKEDTQENEEKWDFKPEKSGLSKIERFNRFIENIVTPKGT